MKIAIIGAGYWGKNLIRTFSKTGTLSCVCDEDVSSLEQLKKDYPDLKITVSFKEVLADSSICAVVISTPARTHYELAKAAFLADKDVFVEKPISLTIENGEELIALAKERKKILMVGHLLEYHPAVHKLKEIMKNGELGKIQYIYSTRLNLGKIRREENILWSFAPHDISAILLLLDEMPESVLSSGGNYLHKDIADVTLSILNFAGGIKGHIFVSWLHPYKEQKLIIVGDKKMAVFDDVSEKDKLLTYSHQINWVGEIPVPKKETAQRIDFVMEEPLLLECKHFIERLKDRKEPKTGGKSALRVLKILDACQRSLEKGGSLINLKERNDESSRAYFAHPTAIIEEPSTIGKGTKIWHYSHIMKGAEVGEDCIIGQNVYVASKASIGRGVKLQNNVSVYDGVVLEDGVFCGPSVVFTNVINPRSHINRKNELGKTLIKRGATLGANSTVICGNSIGEYAFIGAGAVVTKDIPAHALVYGNPARIKGWVCECAEKLQFKKKSACCPACGKKYKLEGDTIASKKE